MNKKNGVCRPARSLRDAPQEALGPADQGGGGGTKLFICFTSRPSITYSGLRTFVSSKAFSPGRGGAEKAPASRPSLSRQLRTICSP
jgi:hypothetical protein